MRWNAPCYISILFIWRYTVCRDPEEDQEAEEASAEAEDVAVADLAAAEAAVEADSEAAAPVRVDLEARTITDRISITIGALGLAATITTDTAAVALADCSAHC